MCRFLQKVSIKELTDYEDDCIQVEFGAEGLKSDDPVSKVFAGVESRVVSLLSASLEHDFCALFLNYLINYSFERITHDLYKYIF